MHLIFDTEKPSQAKTFRCHHHSENLRSSFFLREEILTKRLHLFWRYRPENRILLSIAILNLLHKMSNTNKISAVCLKQTKTATLALLEQVKTKLPFLISTPEAERPKRKMGAKSVEYVNLCLEAAKEYPTKLTVEFDTPEFEKDVDLINQLWAIRIKIGDLLDKVDDTMEAASGDSMKAADRVYELLKAAEKTDGSVSEILRRIAQFYSGQSKPRAKKTNP